MDRLSGMDASALKKADANPAAICCTLTFGFAWLILTAVFLSRHDDFCNKYWENVGDNGVYYGEDMEQYFPNMGGRVRLSPVLSLESHCVRIV